MSLLNHIYHIIYTKKKSSWNIILFLQTHFHVDFFGNFHHFKQYLLCPFIFFFFVVVFFQPLRSPKCIYTRLYTSINVYGNKTKYLLQNGQKESIHQININGLTKEKQKNKIPQWSAGFKLVLFKTLYLIISFSTCIKIFNTLFVFSLILLEN